ncbi:SpoIIE family protein phosphatase [Leptospira sp. 96542]|nr:SpoIIE family protein phosphatase [Leptospira sp. 96542]
MNPSDFHILVVEDNSLIRKMIVHILKKHGYQVDDASDGKLALSKIQKDKPDLVILDIIMPEMDGLELLEKVRQTQSQVELPIILVTAMQGSEDIVKGFELGANDYLPKNFNSAELFARVNTALAIKNYHNLLKIRNNTIERELDIARLIQKKLLPHSAPQIPGYKIASLYVPMDKVGGDYYDFHSMNEYCDFFMADVSGHGVPGAFLASVIKMVTQYTSHLNFDPTEILRVMDQAVSERGALAMFATAVILRLYPNSGKISFSNAGHIPILVHKRLSDEFIELTVPGAPLGINFDFKKKGFVLGHHILDPGDRLILYTDGIGETTNSENIPFDEKRWKEFLIENKNTETEKLTTILRNELQIYGGKTTFEDDLSMVVLDRE